MDQTPWSQVSLMKIKIINYYYAENGPVIAFVNKDDSEIW